MSARPRQALIAVLAGFALLAGCGSASKHDDIRAVVEQFGKASAAHDYQQICDDLIAPALASKVEQIGLPCELAFKRGLDKVRAPKVKIGAIRMMGASAYVRVHSTAASQPPSDDTLRLVKLRGKWRIAALTSTPPAEPSAPPQTTPLEAIPPSSVPPGAIPAQP